jgi:hypothetical protein
MIAFEESDEVSEAFNCWEVTLNTDEKYAQIFPASIFDQDCKDEYEMFKAMQEIRQNRDREFDGMIQGPDLPLFPGTPFHEFFVNCVEDDLTREGDRRIEIELTKYESAKKKKIHLICKSGQQP